MNDEIERIKNFTNNARADLNISIKPGLTTAVNGGGNIMGLMMAILTLAKLIEEKRGGTTEDALNAVMKLNRITDSISCESEEQMKVMQKIIENGMKPEDLKK